MIPYVPIIAALIGGACTIASAVIVSMRREAKQRKEGDRPNGTRG